MTPKSTDDELPPLGKYVLIYMPNRTTYDSGDPEGIKWEIAKRRVQEGYGGNNQRDYLYLSNSCTPYFGQEPTLWCELPEVPCTKDKKQGTD